jgi:aminocarboxymuconate-semialdehyde decarboxylase
VPDLSLAGVGVVDVHTHMVPRLPEHRAKLRDDRWPSFAVDGEIGRLSRDGQVVRTVGPAAWDMDARIAVMDSLGVRRHVLSPLPPLVCDWGEAPDATAWARAVNESIAATVAEHPDRFSGLGTVSLHHPDVLVAELEHVHALGLSGVEIGTSGGGRELDDPALYPFFEAAEALGMRLFVHPLILGSEAGWTERISGHEVTFGLGMGTDTAIAAARLVFGGVTARYPGLSVCLAHGGGTFVWALPRIARLWDRPDRDPAHTAARLSAGIVVDTVLYDPHNVEFLVAALGADRLLFGTDFPLPAQDDLAGGVLSGLDSETRGRVARDNANAWLGLA